jgi:protein O-GlcNAc transferase
LANHPWELVAIRQRLKQNRLSRPLFDTARFAKNMEQAYKQMWRLFLENRPPEQIEVLDRAGEHSGL